MIAWFPCSGVGTHMICIPTLEYGNEKTKGNGSLTGARMCLLSNRIRKDVIEVTKKMTNFELSETSSYMDNYIASLFLPCTDLNLFPRLKARLDARSALQKCP